MSCFARPSLSLSFARLRNIRFFILYTCCFAVLALSSQPLIAQTGAVTLSGTITDTSGALMPEVHITVTNGDTGVATNTKTNKAGVYNVPGLNPGHYRVLAEKEGFKQVDVRNLTLNVQDVVSRNFTLEVGGTSETIQVDGSGASINTTDASVSTVIDRQFVENLPLNGRSFQSLIYLTPGVSLNTAITASNEGQFTVNGQRASSNYWTIDGVSANFGMTVWNSTGTGSAGGLGGFNVLGGTNSLVSVDALQEFRIETSTYPPEFGRMPGGQIAITTRAGTNQFHGTLFDYLRNTVLDANNWFNGYTNDPPLAKAPEQQNDFGGVLGGPIMKDKTFFFFSYEGFRLKLPQTLLMTVPDLETRQNATPGMQPYLNAFPTPRPGVPDISPGLSPFNASFSNPTSVDAYSLRIDHRLTKNLNIFGRYSHSPSIERDRGAFGYSLNTIASVSINTDMITAGTTWMVSSQIVNDTRFNYSQSGGKTYDYIDTFGGGNTPPASSLFPAPYTTQNSLFGLFNEFGTNMSLGLGFGADNKQQQYNVVDTLSWQKNAHSLKFGLDYRRLSPHLMNNSYALQTYFPTLQFLEEGKPQITDLDNTLPVTFLFHNLGVYSQDTWRVSQRLTLTYGLRWDVDFAPTTESGPQMAAVSGFSLTNLSNLAIAPAGTPVFSTRYGGFAPRVGGAYQFRPGADHPLVFRAGFGVFYDLASSETGNLSGYDYPYGASGSTTAPFPTPIAAATPPAILPPSASQGAIQGFDPHLNLPYTLEWNAALEQALSKDETVTLSYIGSSGKRLLATEIINNPNPNYLQAQLVGNAGHSNYGALQVQYQRRLSHGLQALASYTWGHSIDTGSSGVYANGSLADVNFNKGDSDFDIRHNFSAALTYKVPAPTNNAFAKAVLGGWSTDNTFQISSAPPVTVNDTQFASLTAQNASISIRPDVVSGQPFYLHGSPYPGNNALNPSAFANPPLNASTGLPTRQGNLGRNSLRAFGLTQWNFAVHREFPIHESVKLEFRAEMFNVLNHPNFAPYDVNFNPASPDPYFGQSTQMLGQSLIPYGLDGEGGQNPLYNVGGSRSIQLALKLTF